jgi:hypothetical protein
MKNLTFNDLPTAVTKLTEEISEMKRLFIEKQEQRSTEQNETLLTRKQAAEFLNVTFATLNDWTKRGLVECGRISTRVYYKRSNLINAINKFS